MKSVFLLVVLSLIGCRGVDGSSTLEDQSSGTRYLFCSNAMYQMEFFGPATANPKSNLGKISSVRVSRVIGGDALSTLTTMKCSKNPNQRDEDSDSDYVIAGCQDDKLIGGSIYGASIILDAQDRISGSLERIAGRGAVNVAKNFRCR